MPSSPPRLGVRGTGLSSSRNDSHGEASPLLPRRTSGVPGTASSSNRRHLSQAAASRDNSNNLSEPSTTASSLSVNNSSGGVPSIDDDGNSDSGNNCNSRSRTQSGENDLNDGDDNGGGSILGTAPTSLSGFLAIFAHSIALQSWTSYVLAVSFHIFHVLLILSFLTSPILFRSTIFSSQTMAKALLEAQGIIKHKSNNNRNDSNDAGGAGVGHNNNNHSAPLPPSSVSQASVSIESVWAIHDALFFLEPGHVVMPTAIENSFGSLRRHKNRKKGNERNKKNSTGGAGANDAQNTDGDNDDDDDDDDKKDDRENTHTYIVPHAGSADDGDDAAKLLAVKTRVASAAFAAETVKAVETLGANRSRRTRLVATAASDRAHGHVAQVNHGAPFYNFAAPPPVAPKLPLSQRKKATHGQATLAKILGAWEASPLYSSPLALTLFYYLYNIGCVILLLTVTDGMLTGHFSVLRLVISLAELLWYVHHGAHAFVIYCWLCLLSHWPRRASYSDSDVAFLRAGTPYAVVSKASGKVAVHWFYRATSSGGGYNKNEGKILQDEVYTKYYLYDQVWYLKPVASAISVIYLVLLSFCIARDLHRMLDAMVGVRVLMEPEGCMRCPLCGELMEVCQRHRNRRGKSVYQSARDGTSLSMRRTMWWWRWIRSAVRGSSSSRHRVPTPRLHSPLWRWLLPEWCGGGPQGVKDEAAAAVDMSGNVSLEVFANDDKPDTVEDMLEDIEFYEQSAVRRSAAAPQDTMTEETTRLMRWLTVVPKSDTLVAVPVREEQSSSIWADGNEAAEALGIGSSGSSSSEDEVEQGLVKAMPAGTAPARHVSVKTSTGQAREAATRSSTSFRSLWSPMRRQSCGASGQLEQVRPHRVTRFAEEVLYWNYATRHVHHRCPKLYLDTQEATDDEEDDTDANTDTDASGSTDEASLSAGSSVEESASREAAATAGGGAAAQGKGKRVTGMLVAASPARAHVGDAATAASRASFSDRGMRRSLSPRSAAIREGGPAANTADVPVAGASRGGAVYKAGGTTNGNSTNNRNNSSNNTRNYGTIGPNFSEGPAQLYARGQQPDALASHIVQRGVYEPTKDEEDEFRPGNAFQSFDRAGWLSRLTYSWLNPLLTFGLLEPTLLRQERFLPALPEQLLSLDNIAVPAWRLWMHRKTWYATYVAKPGELLIPSNEAMERAEEQVMSLADLHDVEPSDDGDETESSEGKQTIVMLGHTSLKQAAKFRPQRPKRSLEERLLWSVTAPFRYILVFAFYYTYIGTSRTVQRTRRRLVRELLKDRLVAAAEDMYDENGYQAMEASEALEEATWALAEMASSCGSSAAAPSAGSALPTHMRRQLALSDVSLYYLFLEHRCGRRFLLVAAPLLLLSELLTLFVVPVLVNFVRYLQKVDAIEILPGRRETPGDQESVSAALSLAALIGVLLLLQGVVHSAYVSQAQQAAMEARTCVRAMVLEKTLALPLAQRTFSETEVVTLATEEATRVAKCIVSLHHTWSFPLRIVLLSLLLGYYLGWAAATVACVGPFFIVLWLRRAAHDSRQSRHKAEEATKPRLSQLQQALDHVREVKGMLLEGRLMRRLRRARDAEAAYAEELAMTEGTLGMLSGGVTGLLMVVALGAECVFAEKALRDMDVLIPSLVIFLLLTTPLLELPTLFTVVARGFLSMKRIEAYLRQTPDEFVGTWVDLTTFSALQQQLRHDNPSSALLHYRRGSVVCRDSSFTWQHDLTEESPTTLLRDVNVCIEPGQLVVVQGSMGSGKSTLLLSILGEVNRCVRAAGSNDGGGDGSSSALDYESESSFSVVSASEAARAAAAAQASVPSSGTENDGKYSRTLSNNKDGRGGGGGDAGGGAAAAAHCIFVASPTASSDGQRRRRAGHGRPATATVGTAKAGGSFASAAEVALTRIATTAAVRNGPPASRDDSKNRSTSNTSHSGGGGGTKLPSTDRDGGDSTAAPTEASQFPPAGLDDGESSTGGFLVFGSCAYCAEVPWLQNDTIRANIMSSGGPVQLERWYDTVLRACALSADVAALPQGDATVVGDRGELLSLSMRCRIAIARAVYSKSHVYLFDSVLTPLEPAFQEHIIREVFHKLLRKRTVILASNVGLRSLRPHRVFSLVEGGIVREDTELYKAVPSLNARSDEEDEEENEDEDEEEEAAESDDDTHRGSNSKGNSGDGAGSGNASSRSSATLTSSSSSSSSSSQDTTVPQLPTLYAEEFEESREESELDVTESLDKDPMAATKLLFDGEEDFRPRDSFFTDVGDRHHGAGIETGVSGSVLYGSSGANSSGVLRPRRSVHFGPRSPTRHDSQLLQRSLGASGRTSPGGITLPPPLIPYQDSAETKVDASTAVAATSSRQSPTLLQRTDAHDGGEHGGDATANTTAATTTVSETSSCSTGQYIRNHYAQQLEQEKMLRHRHRLSFFIFLRFMGGQVMWLLFTTVFQQFVFIGIDIWAAVWLAVMANARVGGADSNRDDGGGGSSSSSIPNSKKLFAFAKVRHQLYIWVSVTDTVFLGTVSVLTLLTMVLTLLRTRAVYVGVYGTMHFIYDQIVRRIFHAPASYFDSRIIALLMRVLDSDAAAAEYRVPGTAEVLLSCAVQVFFIAAWNAFVNPIFMLLLPVSISLFYHISQRHTVVLREVRKLEVGSVSGMADILREVYQGASTVRCMALQDRLREEYCRALDTVNTASMVAYLADRWVELRLHVLSVLAVCSAAMLGVVFTFSYSRPSLTAVAVVVALRAGPVLQTMCDSLGSFAVTGWISVQRLMSLWSVPQEPLTLEGDADLYNYCHVRRRASGFYVELEGGQNAPMINLVGTPFSSPRTLAAVSQQEHRGKKDGQQPKAGTEDGAVMSTVSLYAPPSPLTAFAAAASSSSSEASPDRSAARPPTDGVEGATITLPQLELRNVSARYRTTLPYVLRHINLAVYPRERLGVVGHAGQGKGSLFNVLMRLVDVIEGGVFVDGEDAAKVPYPILRGWFGLIPQEPLLMHGSWRSNLLMGYHPEHRLFMESTNGADDRPYFPIAALSRQQQQQARDGAASTRATTVTAALASHLGAGSQDETTPLVNAVDIHEGNHRRGGRSNNNNSSSSVAMADGGDSAASLPMSDSYGSTDSTRACMDGEDQGSVRYMDSVEEVGGLSRDAKSPLGRVARRLRDKFSLFHRRSSYSNASGRRERTPSSDAGGVSRGNSGGGRRRRRRRRTSRQPDSRAASGHPVEGPRQPVEDAVLWAALRAVGLDAAVEFDGGLDAALAGGDVSATDLTESQCRLLCLARVVLNKPLIVLLEDAVLSGAEAQTDQVIQRVLANELRDSTAIIIAHRMSTVLNLCTRVVAVRDGTLLPIADLRSTSAVVAPSPQLGSGQRTNVSRNASLTDLATPPTAANIHPDVLRQLSYYVE
ncbi:multi drug resistance protein-like [Lotmaria passim]